MPGVGREKLWDVAWQHTGKYRLGISLKSILRNLGGTVPNRIDDLIGEAANAQLHSPEIVIGYVVVLNRQNDAVSPRPRIHLGDLAAAPPVVARRTPRTCVVHRDDRGLPDH